MANYNFQYLPIKASEVPIAKTYTIGTSTYIFSFTYNSRFDFYTVVISDLDNNILFSTKIVYGEQLYDALVEGLTIDFSIIPISLDDMFSTIPVPKEYQAINAATLDNKVRLYYNATVV